MFEQKHTVLIVSLGTGIPFFIIVPRYYCSSFPKHFDPKDHVGGNKKAQQETDVKDGVSDFEFAAFYKFK